ncbi:MAG TPA: Gfo/Idh/MocA family oxidoreductase [Saprospiraceae bacterium]|nr:Gfo/Idh/MocA family oxidoreductase [Saprospiraceae bacterium]
MHRMAAALDGEIDLVCGAFSSDPQRSRASGRDLHLPPERCYGNFAEMIEQEKNLPEHLRMHFVSIVTPNHVHHPPAMMALQSGFHVICDKPLAFNLKEALELEQAVKKSGLLFALTHNYTGYPMVKQARQMIRHGELGSIRKVVVEYPQGWLSTHLEAAGQKQAAWRTDPARSGAAGAMGDIGTHAENLAEYITGLRISQLCADISTFVPGRLLDDDGSVLLRFEGGAKGILYASQISAGEENDLRIRVYGEKGGLEWRQMEPNTLIVKWLDRPVQLYRTGGVGPLYPEAGAHTRVPAGHPEGYLEAFANIYRNFAHCVRARMEGRVPDAAYTDFPTVHDGVRGMRFIEKVIESGKSEQKWVDL